MIFEQGDCVCDRQIEDFCNLIDRYFTKRVLRAECLKMPMCVWGDLCQRGVLGFR